MAQTLELDNDRTDYDWSESDTTGEGGAGGQTGGWAGGWQGGYHTEDVLSLDGTKSLLRHSSSYRSLMRAYSWSSSVILRHSIVNIMSGLGFRQKTWLTCSRTSSTAGCWGRWSGRDPRPPGCLPPACEGGGWRPSTPPARRTGAQKPPPGCSRAGWCPTSPADTAPASQRPPSARSCSWSGTFPGTWPVFVGL